MKFNMYAVSTVCVYFDDLEAEDLEAAEKKAWELLGEKDTGLCHSCNEDLEMDDNWEIKGEEVEK